MATADTEALPQPRHGQTPSRSRSSVVLLSVITAGGVAFAVLAGLDGSPAWRVARVLAVVALTTLAVWVTRRAGRVGQGTAALLLGIAGTTAGAGIASAHVPRPASTRPPSWRPLCCSPACSCSAGAPSR